MLVRLLLSLFVLFTMQPVSESAEREVPVLPEKGEKIRVLIDTDAACEIDDLYAIALALVSQERLQIEGFVAAHFGDAGGPNGIERSYQAIKTVMEKAGLAGTFPVKRGSPPFQFSRVPIDSPGVDFIIEQAMQSTPDDPLWVVSLGACTNIANAVLKKPEIKDRVVSFWHGRTQWPLKCWNFNAYNDLKAVRIMFASDLPLVLFDTGTYLRCPMEKSKRILYPYGELGAFLHDFRLKSSWYQSPRKGFYDLGDIAALVDPSLVEWEVAHVPEVQWDMDYVHNKKHGKMLRIYQIDRDATFSLFHDNLKTFYSEK